MLGEPLCPYDICVRRNFECAPGQNEARFAGGCGNRHAVHPTHAFSQTNTILDGGQRLLRTRRTRDAIQDSRLDGKLPFPPIQPDRYSRSRAVCYDARRSLLARGLDVDLELVG